MNEEKKKQPRKVTVTEEKIGDAPNISGEITEHWLVVEIDYNDGSMRRSARGYWLSVHVEERKMLQGRMIRTVELSVGGGGTMQSEKLESAERFNAKRLQQIADAAKSELVELDITVKKLKDAVMTAWREKQERRAKQRANLEARDSGINRGSEPPSWPKDAPIDRE